MSNYARVLDVQELAAFRAMLVKLSEGVRNGVAAGDAEVRDMQRWLTQEQPQVWARRIKKLERQLADAKEALRRKQSTPTPTGEPPNVMLEKNQVRRAKALLEEAHERAQRTKLWGRRFEREESAYRGATNGARSAAQSTLPGAMKALDALLSHLEDYLRLNSAVPADAAEPAGAAEGSMARPIDDGALTEESPEDSEDVSDRPGGIS